MNEHNFYCFTKPCSWLTGLVIFLFSFGRAEASTFTVSNLDDSGAGSLRQAIEDANDNPGYDVIQFSTAGNLLIINHMPAISDSLTIDGTTAPGYVEGAPAFIIDSEVTTAIYATDPSYLTIHGLGLISTHGFIAPGLRLISNSGSVLVEDCIIANWSTGISCEGNAEWTIRDNDLSTSQRSLKLIGVHTISASGNLFGGINSFSGLEMANCSGLVIGNENAVPAADILIREADGMGAVPDFAIYTQYCSDLTFDHLDLSYTASPAFGFSLFMEDSYGTITIRNSAFRNRYYGPLCKGNAHWIITDNDFSSSSVGLQIENVISGSILAHNNLYGGTDAGLGLYLSGCHNLIIGDENVTPTPDILIRDSEGLNEVAFAPITLADCNNIVVDNIDVSYTGNTTSGQGVGVGSNSGSIVIRNCKIQNRETALFCSGEANWTLHDNDLRNSLNGMDIRSIHSDNLTAYNNLLGGPGAQTGIALHNCSNLVIGDENAIPAADILIKDTEGLTSFANTAILAYNCSDMTFDNLDASYTGDGQAGYGINLVNNQGALILQNCKFSNRQVGFSGNAATGSLITCNVFSRCVVGTYLALPEANNSFFNNAFVNNTYSLSNSGPLLIAQYNYWGGGTPSTSGPNAYEGPVDASNHLTIPAGCTPVECTDADLDGWCDDQDNCSGVYNPDQVDTDGDGAGDVCDGCPYDADKTDPGQCGCGVADADTDGDGLANCLDNCDNAANPNQADSDCDGVGDACDICPGGDDTMDNNQDGIPDCSQLLAYADYSDTWKCGNNKIRICHSGNSLCINKNALALHFNHGDMVGPCTNCGPISIGSRVESTEEDLLEHFGAELEISPNPASEEVNIFFHGLEPNATLNIVNQLGQVVWTSPLQPEQSVLTLDLSEHRFINGVYFVQVVSENQRLAQRLVIAR